MQKVNADIVTSSDKSPAGASRAPASPAADLGDPAILQSSPSPIVPILQRLVTEALAAHRDMPEIHTSNPGTAPLEGTSYDREFNSFGREFNSFGREFNSFGREAGQVPTRNATASEDKRRATLPNGNPIPTLDELAERRMKPQPSVRPAP